MKKRFLAVLLTLVLALALAVPAFAESVTINGEASITFSDVVSREEIKCSAYNATLDATLVTVEVGTSVSIFSQWSPYFSSASVAENGIYNFDSSKKLDLSREFTLTEEHIGLWCFNSGMTGHRFIKVVPAGGSAAPSTPAQPEQPTQPSEPEQPSTPVQPEQPTTPTQPAQPSTPAQPEKPTVVVPEGAITYTAVKGDTWGHLALNNYGTYAVWKQLKAANKGVTLKAGAEIVLPATLGKSVRLPAQVLGEGETLYTVQAGDTLGAIAANYYGNIKRYTEIFERNSDRLTNANLIYEGQVLVLPAK